MKKQKMFSPKQGIYVSKTGGMLIEVVKVKKQYANFLFMKNQKSLIAIGHKFLRRHFKHIGSV